MHSQNYTKISGSSDDSFAAKNIPKKKKAENTKVE